MTVKWIPGPDLPPPSLETGVWGWLKKNLFSSVPNTVLTLLGIFFIVATVPPFVRWAFLNATWLGETREACTCMAEDAPGACWVFIKVRLGMFMYGFYPEAERWRVNLTLLFFALGMLPILLHDRLARGKAETGLAVLSAIIVFMLFGGIAGSVAALFFLGPFGLSRTDFSGLFAAADGRRIRRAGPLLSGVLVCVAAVRFAESGAGSIAASVTLLLMFGTLIRKASVRTWQWIFLFCIYPFIAYHLLMGDAFGLPFVDTHMWGGMFLTLVIAGIGIATSLPIGILLALGRRSEMTAVRTLCVCFIELIRGVPLISVLFMASVMLPLFLPEGTQFNKLLRALIGVALFYAAYMAEVIRGGLQAMPKGQYEAAEALGLGYWRMMGLVILPQTLRLVIPGIVNTFLGLFKDTTLVAVIGLMDMLGIVKTALADTEWLGFPKEAYVFAAAVYWIFCFGMSRYSMYLEGRFQVKRR
ncbi:amino acid ABC transporter permease [Desulfonema ishimotonii]|uniref:Amino acid ABC transporter permease n=1 Tax=Desulfonema ishimotonii TaxID=45657 RepID=A0A401FU47_9BACT|nr:amino acid ABC transporter permease [Desulfonema ishimotonii]GBC60480.1 amino acid ABC transporter permease [Desulfonema ishimotonii]